jgi:hypothetical protein
MNKFILLCLAALLASSNATVADSTVAGQIAKESMEIAFTETERALIRKYFGHSGGGYQGQESKRGGEKKGNKGKKADKGAASGLAGGGSLPPGLQRQLDKNGALPPGLQKKALPPGLQSRLPPVPRGYERVIVDTNVLLVEAATGIVRDVITDVVREVLN